MQDKRQLEMFSQPGRYLKEASPERRQEIARLGGQTISQDRTHMAEIGRKGGQKVSQNREHMAEIGRKGGSVSRIKK